jgi:multimeric flavodoxin WrbA
VCIYRDADDVASVYDRLMTADVLVFAGAIRDRYLSSRWKQFFDRGFFHNHVPLFAGKQLGYLISGPLAQIPNLRQILEAYTELQRANLAGLVSDDGPDSAALDGVLDGLARRLVACAQTGYQAPSTFLGVAGRKLLRDEIWGNLRLVFHADHRYYKSHGLYDFPRRSLKTRLTNAVVRVLTTIPRFRKEFLKRIKSEMVKPLERVLDEV